ncbi:P-loop containing nucleoside triphosphate hydrolase protein [Suillus subalutaceus]|uniref:P-loop containing nucleoside triphosphate hydrolase protein n=1 Tax=Suillus subalutaceus TaxID=48586 RepID=UPI001B881F2E|nr:P-loop containing nucleoside triphosphate hydrolase protein [Suillus subalutaceus]KAG1845086.1 P-loop containing nucleoside triphosphate hydrolase protein [Suillus subalutaceus]
MARRIQRRTITTRPGKFDPEDARRVKHTRIGVWDLYEDRQTDIPRIPGSSRLETYAQIVQSMPHVLRIGSLSLPHTRHFLMVLRTTAAPCNALFVSICPAHLSLTQVETAIESRTVDTTVLIHVAVGRVACTVATRLLQYARSRIVIPINMSIKQFYAGHIFHSMARLDVPTFEDSAVQRQLESAWASPWGTSVAWETVQSSTNVVMTQQDGPLLAILSFSQSVFQWYSTSKGVFGSLVWAATTTNEDYVRMQGLKHLVDNPSHRKEVVAGNLGEYVTAQFRESAKRVGDDAGEFPELRRAHTIKDRLSIASILREPMRELPQIVFTLRAVQKPMTIPLSHLTRSAATLFSLFGESFSLAEQFANVRKLYEIENVQNKVVDGAEPFPENHRLSRVVFLLSSGMFRSDTLVQESYALQNVSFTIEAGRLCVIVGVNGSGKSTILKLICRIYDPTEGTIFIDNRDIKTLRLADLRAAMSILFQDYTHFPLSISENIGLGNPALAHDYDKVREAARLGGAEHFIDKLPGAFDTYLDRPVKDYYAGLPEGTTTLFGRSVDYSRVRGVGGLRASEASSLSGGQMQRLAVSRTFMRSLVSETESSAGMLLFDEPSASLDPTAEHDLFERLRNLRGNKTMIFSSHRFGNLTRHADLILYMDESAVQEEGTHDDLLKRGGEYARIWNLQASAFV